MGGQQIHNVAKGTNDNDAVNVAQLKKVSEAAASASQGWKLKTQNGNASDVKPGATVEFDGDANIQVGNDGNKVSVTLKNQLTGIQSITGEGAGSISFANDGIKFNNKVTINKDGKITGVADGKISADSKEAVNGSQLNAVKETANKGWNLSTNGDKASTKVATGARVDMPWMMVRFGRLPHSLLHGTCRALPSRLMPQRATRTSSFRCLHSCIALNRKV